jgi:hypothetical protein
MFPILVVVVLAYFTGKQLSSNPLSILYLFIAILIAVIYNKKPYIVITILIIFGINIFDAIPLSNIPHLTLPVVGNQIDSQFLVFLIFIMFLNFIVRRHESIRSPISYPIIALILLTGGQVIRSFLEGNDPHFIIDRAKVILFYLSFFLILSSFRNKNELIIFLKLFVPIALISAGTTYFQIITGIELAPKIQYLEEYNIFRVVPLSLYAMSSVFLIIFSIALGKKVKTKYFSTYIVILLWIGGAIALTFIRNIWISTLLCMSIIIILNISRLKQTVIVLGLIWVFFLGGLSLFKIITGTDLLSMVADRVSIGYHDIQEKSGTFRYRIDSMALRWNYMMETNPIFGHGYKGIYYDRVFQQSHLYDPTIAEGDNIIGYISVRYGLAGFFVMIWLLYTVFYKAINLLKAFPPSWQKSVVYGLLAFNIQMVIISYFASVYMQIWAIVILAPSWAILELIDRFYIKGPQKSLQDVP